MAKKKFKFAVNRCVIRNMTIEEGLALIKDARIDSPPLYIDGERVKRAFQRFAVLSQGPLTCFECGVKGTHFMIERHRNENYYHINVYAGNKLLTWDHIIPKSLGGSNHHHNGRVACEACNGRRGNEMSIHELLWAMRQNPNEVYKTKTPLKKILIPSMKKFEGFIHSAEVRNGALSRA